MPFPFENSQNKGQPSGYAPLDANSKVPTANLPDQASLDAEVDGKITTHNSATTSVHGIANTANLVLTNDARLSDTRDPKAHTHAPSEITGTAVITNDSRLSDPRTPTAHSHAISEVTSLQTALDGKALSSHTHTINNVTGLQTALDGKQASGSYAPATGIAPSAITGTAVITTDSRLSDSRVPTSHTHGNITNAGAVGSTANLPLITTTSGAITTGSFGTTANTFCEGNDSRISGIAGNKINIGVYGGSISSDGYGGSINTGGYGGSIFTDNYGGTINTGQFGGSITTGPYGGSINTAGQGSIGLGTLVSQGGGATGQTTILGSASGTDKTITLPNATGTVALTSDSRFTDSRAPTAHSHSIADVTSLQATLTAFAIALG
jgi:hypothetical protein